MPETAFTFLECPLDAAALGHVVDDGREQWALRRLDGAAVDLYIPNFTVGEAMAEIEIEALLRLRLAYFRLDFLLCQGVDVLDAHGQELFASIAVERHGRAVGVDDAAILRVEDELDRRVGLEGLALALFAGLQLCGQSVALQLLPCPQPE